MRALMVINRRGPLDSCTVFGADIVGATILEDGHLGMGLTFASCTFDAPLVMTRADASFLAFRDCSIPGVAADGLTLRHGLELIDSKVFGESPSDASKHASGWTSAISLEGAKIGGSMSLQNSRIENSAGMAIYGHHLEVGKRLRLSGGFAATGHVQLVGASIGRELVLIDARIACTNGASALSLNGSSIGSSLVLAGGYRNPSRELKTSTYSGSIDLNGARVGGQVVFRGGEVDGRGRPAISARALRVEGDVVLDDANLVGPVILNRSDIGGNLNILGATTLRGAGNDSPALDFSFSSVGGQALIAPSVECSGSVNCDAASIEGSLIVKDLRLRAAVDEPALSSRSIAVRSDIDARGLICENGAVDFSGARLQGNFRGSSMHSTFASCVILLAGFMLLGPRLW